MTAATGAEIALLGGPPDVSGIDQLLDIRQPQKASLAACFSDVEAVIQVPEVNRNLLSK